jgi:hypothetical protein
MFGEISFECNKVSVITVIKDLQIVGEVGVVILLGFGNPLPVVPRLQSHRRVEARHAKVRTREAPVKPIESIKPILTSTGSKTCKKLICCA